MTVLLVLTHEDGELDAEGVKVWAHLEEGGILGAPAHLGQEAVHVERRRRLVVAVQVQRRVEALR